MPRTKAGAEDVNRSNRKDRGLFTILEKAKAIPNESAEFRGLCNYFQEEIAKRMASRNGTKTNEGKSRLDSILAAVVK